MNTTIARLATIAMLSGAVAWAQTGGGSFTCQANAVVAPTVRSEGITELIGDVILNCTGGKPTPAGQQVPVVLMQVALNANVTSRLLPGSDIWTDALLLIDEPATSNIKAAQTTNASTVFIAFSSSSPGISARCQVGA